MMSGVSSRTRSKKNVPLFGSSFSLDGSSSKRRKNVEDDLSFDSVSESKKRRIKDEPFVVPEHVEVISIDDDDEDEKGSKQCDEKKGSVDVRKEVKIDESGASFEISDNDESDDPITICSDDEEHFVVFDSVDEADDEEEEEDDDEDDDGVTICSDDEEHFVGFDSVDEADDDDDDEEEEEEEEDDDDKDDGGVKGVKSDERGEISEFDDKDQNFIDLNDSDDSDNDVDDSVETDNDDDDDDSGERDDEVEDDDESEEHDTSDEDFEVDELNEISDNDDDSSCGSDDDDEKRNKMRKDFNVVEELVREVKDRQSGISVNNDEIEHSDYGGVTKANTIEKKGSFDPMKGCSSNQIKASKKQKAKTVVSVSDNDNDVGDSDERKQEYVEGLNVGGVSSVQTKQEKISDSDKQKITENNRRDYKCSVSIRYGEKKETVDNNGLNQRVNSTLFMRTELYLAKLLAEQYRGDEIDTVKIDSILLKVKDDAVDLQDTRPPPVCVEMPQSIWSLKKVEKVQKTKEEEELEEELKEQQVLWDQMNAYLRESEAESNIGSLGTNEAKEENMGNPSTLCEHDTRLDEEIGVYCRRCGVVITEIKYISPLVVDRFPNEGSEKRTSYDDSVNASPFDGSRFNVSDDKSVPNFLYNGCTVWDLIPGVKQTLYNHQQEGFEFIWKNLAGNIHLHKLKNADPPREGGCIISHAPGTGKTRLTIVFLMAYLKVFPKCCPVIVAPAGLLLTWEDEFKKWDIGVPFHNLSNPELTGKEHEEAVNCCSDTRMVKLTSWLKEKSILGISYTLYSILAGEGGKSKGKKEKNHHSEKMKNKKYADVEKGKETNVVQKFLLEVPGLLILDEGHTPRNRKSHIWKVLSEVQTRKRVILSGTPFQNNFLELYNTFSLVKPSFPNTIPHKLKNFCKRKNAVTKWSWGPVSDNSTTGNPSDDKIKQLKLLMDPFVHVQKGTILQKKLPGLRNCIMTLKADSFQKQILGSIKSSQYTFAAELKLTMASIHPSLLLECDLLEDEEAVIDKGKLEKLRLNPYVGVKTKFVVELARLCAAFNEKVLVFSELLGPLSLIKDQLMSILEWADKEILYMDGSVGLKDKQSLIHSFNDENCQAKIMLASTKACSEGISLVGASRVVLLDVVWNPSVERQAISRAYRIGQKRIVYTYHLLTDGTAEYTKYCKQAEKDRLSELVFTAK